MKLTSNASLAELAHARWKSRRLLSVISLSFGVGETNCSQGNGGWGRGGGEWKCHFSAAQFEHIPPAEHNFEHNTLVSRVTPESIILYFSCII